MIIKQTGMFLHESHSLGCHHLSFPRGLSFQTANLVMDAAPRRAPWKEQLVQETVWPPASPWAVALGPNFLEHIHTQMTRGNFSCFKQGFISSIGSHLYRIFCWLLTFSIFLNKKVRQATVSYIEVCKIAALCAWWKLKNVQYFIFCR